MRRNVDRFLRLLARTVMAVWFRGVEVVGAERVPADGPVLIVGSHSNGLLDPALVVYATARMPRFLGASTFWRNPVLARVLDLVGALPVNRQKEGRTEENAPVFEACHRALAQGEVVALFPEGVTHDEPRLATLRTGAARIALGARRAGVSGLRIVPIGLLYSAKTRPRSRALVRVGDPIDLDRDFRAYVDPGSEEGPDNADAVRRLTADVQRRLAAAALDYEDADLALVAGRAAAIALRPAGAPHGWEPPLDELDRCARAIVAAAPAAQLAVVRTFVAYHDALSLLDVDDAALVAGDLTPAVMGRRYAQLAAVGALLPVAGAGAVLHAPGAGLVWAAGRIERSRPMRATVRLLAGLVAFPSTWVGLRWLLGRWGVRHPTALTVLAGPASGLIALALGERIRALRSARASLRRLREHSAVLPALVAARTDLVEAVVAAVDVTVGSPPASGETAADG